MTRQKRKMAMLALALCGSAVPACGGVDRSATTPAVARETAPAEAPVAPPEPPFGVAGSPMAQRLEAAGIEWAVMQRSSHSPLDEGPFSALVARTASGNYVCNGVTGTDTCWAVELDATSAALLLSDWEGTASVTLSGDRALHVPLPDGSPTEIRPIMVDGPPMVGPELRDVTIDDPFEPLQPLANLEIVRSQDRAWHAVRDAETLWLCRRSAHWGCVGPVASGLPDTVVLTELIVVGPTWQLTYEAERTERPWTAGALFVQVADDGTASPVFRLTTDIEERHEPVDDDDEGSAVSHFGASLTRADCFLVGAPTLSGGAVVTPAPAELPGASGPPVPFGTSLEGAWRITSSGLVRTDDCPE